MATGLLAYLSFFTGLCFGLRYGRTIKRITRLVMIRGKTRQPRMAIFDGESLDNMEDAIISRFVQGQLVPAELDCFDQVRRHLAERAKG